MNPTIRGGEQRVSRERVAPILQYRQTRWFYQKTEVSIEGGTCRPWHYPNNVMASKTMSILASHQREYAYYDFGDRNRSITRLKSLLACLYLFQIAG